MNPVRMNLMCKLSAPSHCSSRGGRDMVTLHPKAKLSVSDYSDFCVTEGNQMARHLEEMTLETMTGSSTPSGRRT